MVVQVGFHVSSIIIKLLFILLASMHHFWAEPWAEPLPSSNADLVMSVRQSFRVFTLNPKAVTNMLIYEKNPQQQHVMGGCS